MNNSPLQLFKDTQLAYQQQQLRQEEMHILLLNHVAMNDVRVNNYIGKVRLKSKQQRVSVEPIRFHDESGKELPLFDIHKHPSILTSEHPPTFRSFADWNYAETQQLLVLYWPAEKDLFYEVLAEMAHRPYQPRLAQEIFIAHKQDYQVFRRARVILSTPAEPRSGCSAHS